MIAAAITSDEPVRTTKPTPSDAPSPPRAGLRSRSPDELGLGGVTHPRRGCPAIAIGLVPEPSRSRSQFHENAVDLRPEPLDRAVLVRFASSTPATTTTCAESSSVNMTMRMVRSYEDGCGARLAAIVEVAEEVAGIVVPEFPDHAQRHLSTSTTHDSRTSGSAYRSTRRCASRGSAPQHSRPVRRTSPCAGNASAVANTETPLQLASGRRRAGREDAAPSSS